MKNRKIKTTIVSCSIAIVASLAIFTNHASGQINFSAGTYSQNFDTLANEAPGGTTWTDDSTLTAWYITKTSGGTAVTTYRATNGNVNAGSIYSYGTGTSTERALGSIASGTPGNFAYGVRFKNDTAFTISNIMVSYTGEQWRNGGNTSTQSLAFSYLISNSAITDSQATNSSTPWMLVNSLDFNSPTVGATAGQLDGNDPTNRTAIAGSLTGVIIGVGQEIFFRWYDPNDAGNDHGLAVDDLTISFTTVPATTLKPIITQQPTNTTVTEGSAATFSVAVTGSQPFDYQWYYTNGGVSTLISGAVGPSFTTNAVPISITGYGFFATISNVAGSATSSVAKITVQSATPPTVSTITNLHQLRDADFVLTNTTTRFQATGVVTTPFNLLASAGAVASFYMQDNTGGIDVFYRNPGGSLPFPNQGDSVRVTAPLVQFNGTLELAPTNDFPTLYTIEILSTGNALPSPKLLNFATIDPTLMENAYEGSLVYLTNVFLGVTNVDGMMHVGQSIYATNLTGQSFRLVVANNVSGSLDLAVPPAFAVSVTGVIEQSDSTPPLDSGYNLLIYDSANIVAGTPPVIVTPIPLTIQLAGANAQLTWTNGPATWRLEAAPQVTGTYTNVPGATSPYLYPISGTNIYFRLVNP